MVIYVTFGGASVSHVEDIMRDLQRNDVENTYITPVTAFSHLQGEGVPFKFREEARIDLLSLCDKLMVYGYSRMVSKEIDFANLVNMEVEYID